MPTQRELTIGDRLVGDAHPTYFVADVGANHDGDLERAKELVRLAAAAGADAVKFQNFTAETIVSDRGFRDLGRALSHQSGWQGSVFDVYAAASLDLGWTRELRDACTGCGVEYMTSPYAPELVDAVDPFLRAFKIGSGEITWLGLIEHVAAKGKPVLLACGASELAEVDAAMAVLARAAAPTVLMQCNTNYTGSLENLRHVNLNVITAFRERFPGAVIGLSDHTPGPTTVLGAVALGARVVEKHFTDDTSRRGPDHAFAMTPATWREMMLRTRELEAALGDGVKRVEENERETVVVQRRALRARRPLAPGAVVSAADVVPLRPCPEDAATPAQLDLVVGRSVRRAVDEGEAITWALLA